MTDAIQKAREALASIPHGAIDALANNQRQLDMDGCEVGVSRQAVDEVLAGLRAALAALDAETEVKVRELEWIEGKATYPFYTASALKLFYVIRTGGAAMDGQFSVDVDGRSLKPDGFETLEAAKAAAQADFERRIRSALVPPESRS